MSLDVQLDDDGHWLMNADGTDLALIDGIDEQAQSMRTELRTQQGTSIYDPSFGIPYREQVLVRAPDVQSVANVFRGTILGRDDVASVPVFRINLDLATSKLTVTFEAVSTNGEVIADEVTV